MHTSLSKKLLAGLLSLVMVLSLVAPGTSAQAATKYSLTDKKSVKSGYTFKYELKGVSKGCYVKVTRNVSGEKVVYNKKELTKTTKVNGTGKTLNLYVTYGEKDENYTGKFTVRVYGKKTNKLYKTLVEEVTVKVPEKEEPEEPVEEEAALVSLEATGAKELTATLSKEATVTAADLVVKKGTIKVTPADVAVDGTKVVITLGSKITEGTYSVTYKEKTVEVATEDEKLVELKTVGSNLAQVDDADLTTGTGKDDDASTLNAEIEYQALNQYGETMAAEITNVTSTFGGKANFTEPTTKKNGVISIVNINAALGIVGTVGRVIIISKTGVSTTNEVTFSEEAKVSKVELVGIYNVAAGSYVDAIPAQTNVANYKLIIKAYNQYGNVIPYNVYNKKMYQNVSVAQVLTNVTVDGITGNKLTATSFDEVTINNEDCVALKLTTSDGDKTAAGSFQLIIVGDRFGSVMNETINVTQISLIKSFTMSAQDSIYNKDENVLDFTAVDTEGNNVTDYETLKKLVRFAHPSNFYFVKNTDGSATLVCKPSESMNTSNDNKRETTVISETVTCNDLISAADTLVTPKTFTVYEDKQPASIVKFEGSIASTSTSLDLKKAKFVFEDQYGNTLSSKDTCYARITVDYKYGTNAAVTGAGFTSGKLTFTVSSAATKLYISVAGASNDSAGNFDVNKAQLTLNLSNVDPAKATNLGAMWNGAGNYLRVGTNQKESGINETMFLLWGTVDGKLIYLAPSQYSIKNDSYTVITNAEAETAVKKATVTFTVLLTDVDGKEYTEEVSCDYEYSAAPEKVWAIYNYSELNGAEAFVPVTGAAIRTAGSMISTDQIANLFWVCDQYGSTINAPVSYEISLGKNSDKWVVKNNNTASAYIDLSDSGASVASSANVVEFTVIATLRNGMTSTQKVYVKADYTP